MGQLVDEVITLLALGDQLLDHLTAGSHHALVGSAPDWYSTPDQPLMGESPLRSLAVSHTRHPNE